MVAGLLEGSDGDLWESVSAAVQACGVGDVKTWLAGFRERENDGKEKGGKPDGKGKADGKGKPARKKGGGRSGAS